MWIRTAMPWIRIRLFDLGSAFSKQSGIVLHKRWWRRMRFWSKFLFKHSLLQACRATWERNLSGKSQWMMDHGQGEGVDECTRVSKTFFISKVFWGPSSLMEFMCKYWYWKRSHVLEVLGISSRCCKMWPCSLVVCVFVTRSNILFFCCLLVCSIVVLFNPILSEYLSSISICPFWWIFLAFKFIYMDEPGCHQSATSSLFFLKYNVLSLYNRVHVECSPMLSYLILCLNTSLRGLASQLLVVLVMSWHWAYLVIGQLQGLRPP